jgi:hypothetical protein
MQINQKLNENYWASFKVEKFDIDFIYNFLLEKEIPQPTQSLIRAIIENRIILEREKKLSDEKGDVKIYFPKEKYEIGDNLRFPSLNGSEGNVKQLREGFNPDLDPFTIITVEFSEDNIQEFATGIAEHPLNHIFDLPEDDPNYDVDHIMENYGEQFASILDHSLSENEDLVKIAGSWFPQSLLIDVHVGHLNLVEAILEEASGGPISTSQLMNQVELEANADKKLLEFSFNFALQEDPRFDEVGPAGETLWFLHVMEPESVRKTPIFLKNSVNISPDFDMGEYLDLFESTVYDELENQDLHTKTAEKAIISLSYPHWRAGTLPLTKTLSKMFPTAYEAPRVKFSFVDNGDKFAGWVVRSEKYVYGLEEWYQKNDIIPGSLINVSKGKNPGEIVIGYKRSRQNKEWLKTVLVGSDNGIVFAMLKQPINADYNERMALVVTDVEALDNIWHNKTFLSEPLVKTVNRILHELIKLNPQGQVHAQEIYASVNVIRRCPPSNIIKVLIENPEVEYLGDLYFRYKDKGV